MINSCGREKLEIKIIRWIIKVIMKIIMVIMAIEVGKIIKEIIIITIVIICEIRNTCGREKLLGTHPWLLELIDNTPYLKLLIKKLDEKGKALSYTKRILLHKIYTLYILIIPRTKDSA